MSSNNDVDIVPYNPCLLLAMFETHINVEICGVHQGCSCLHFQVHIQGMYPTVTFRDTPHGKNGMRSRSSGREGRFMGIGEAVCGKHSRKFPLYEMYPHPFKSCSSTTYLGRNTPLVCLTPVHLRRRILPLPVPTARRTP